MFGNIIYPILLVLNFIFAVSNGIEFYYTRDLLSGVITVINTTAFLWIFLDMVRGK